MSGKRRGLEATAYHEAGHAAVLIHEIGIARLRFVQIFPLRSARNPDGLPLGICVRRRPILTKADVHRINAQDLTPVVRDRLEKAALISLGGHHAVKLLGRKSYGCGSDFSSVLDYLERVDSIRMDTDAMFLRSPTARHCVRAAEARKAQRPTLALRLNRHSAVTISHGPTIAKSNDKIGLRANSANKLRLTRHVDAQPER